MNSLRILSVSPCLHLATAILASLLWAGQATAATDLNWDPGDTQAGSQAIAQPDTTGGGYLYRVVVPTAATEGMRVRLTVTAGEAHLYLKQGAEPTTGDFNFSSTEIGSDLLMLQNNEFAAGQEWFVLVDAQVGAEWDLLVGDAAVPLSWDPGDTHSGTVVYQHPGSAPGWYWFKINPQEAVNGGWRNALSVTSGDANLYLRHDWLPNPLNRDFASERVGSDGFVVRPDQFQAGQDWYLLVHVPVAATWRLVCGDLFVEDLGALKFTDADADGSFDFTETPLESGSGVVPVGPEGIRYFKATVPPGTPAWCLWLGGAANVIHVRKNTVPFPDAGWGPFAYAERVQTGHMLLVPDYLQASSDTYFIGVPGTPGADIHLRSAIHTFTEIPFNSTRTVTCTGADAGYRTFRVQVPIDQIAWENAVTNVSGDGNVCLRRDEVPNEWHNDAIANSAGVPTDSVTLSPPTLTNGTFFITIYGTTTYQVSFRNGNPVVTNVPFLGTTVNDTPDKTGWRYYAVTDIASQFGLGWELELGGAPAGTEIAIRRNAVPARWRFRDNDNPGYFNDSNGHVDFSSSNGLLQQVDHQSDVWYIGIYNPTEALGAFTLTRRLATASALAFDAGNSSQSNHLPAVWRWFRVEVPAGPLGWDLRLRDISSGIPHMVVRRDLLPGDLGYWYGYSYHFPENSWTPGVATAWPSGHQWAASSDFTQRDQDPGPVDATWRHLTCAMGHPLEPGTYYVGVRNDDPSVAASYTLESRGIGVGQAISVTDVAFAGGTSPVTGLAPRDLGVYKITVPPDTPHWSLRLTPSTGELMMVVRHGGVATDNHDFPPYWPPAAHNPDSPGMRVSKQGGEYLSIFPADGEEYLPAGDYYVTVVSDGDLPPDASTTGAGASSGTLASLGSPAVDLGPVVTGSPVSRAVTLFGGETKIYSVEVAAGTATLEVRLDSRTGNPRLAARPGAAAPANPPWFEYGYDGGSSSGTQTHASILTFANPPAGRFTITVRAAHSAADYKIFPDATANLVVSAIPPTPLNFGSYANSAGGSNQNSHQIIDDAKIIYQISVPTSIAGQPVLGWKVDTILAQGDVSIKVFKDFVNRRPCVETTKDTVIIAPPFFTPGDTWYVEVTGVGITDYTIISEPATLLRPAWSLPADGQFSTTPGLIGSTTFGDSGLTTAGDPLPGDQGTDLGQDDWHFYAITVPSGNRRVLRTVLEALNGDPDIYLRRGDIPSPLHRANPDEVWEPVLQDYASTGTGTHYGNWVPISARFEDELAPGTWYLGVTAAGSTNCRYRLKAATGNFQPLAMNGGSLVGQNLLGGDWHYYVLQTPETPPANWNITFGTQQGAVQVHWRDTLPPGDCTGSPRTYDDLRNAYDDQLNQGPFSNEGWTSPGTYTVISPPLRPNSRIYLGVKALSDATFSISSTTGGSAPAVPDALDFFTGRFEGNVPLGDGPVFRIDAPADAYRFKFHGSHSGNVEFRLEQGAWPAVSGAAHHSIGLDWPDFEFNQVLAADLWPWQPGRTYYLRLVNHGSAPEPVIVQLGGRTAFTDDENNNGLYDHWESTHFPSGWWWTDGLWDPDGDGLGNLLEAMLGSDPVQADAVSPAAPLVTGTPRVLGIRFELADPVPSDAVLVVEGSDDLQSGHWQAVATRLNSGGWTGSGTVEVSTPANGKVTVTVHDSAHTGAEARFLRLKVSR